MNSTQPQRAPYITGDLTKAALAEAVGGHLSDVTDNGGRLTFTFTEVPADFDRRLQLDQVEVRGLAVLLATQRFVGLARDAQARRAKTTGASDERSRS